MAKILWAAVATVVGAMLWAMACTMPGIPWNPARLAPSFALVRGLPIYALRDSGAQLGWMYGPVFPLWFSPAGLTDNPTVGLLLAWLLNVLTVGAGIFLCCRYALRGTTGDALRLTMLGFLLLLANAVTHQFPLFIHVDMLCIVFSLVALVALQAGVEEGWRPGLPLAAFALVLAIATKQLAIILIPATITWLIWTNRRALVGRWVYWLGLVGGATAIVFVLVFGAEELWFNLVFAARFTQGEAILQFLPEKIWQLLRGSWLWELLALAGWIAFQRRPTSPSPRVRSLAGLLGWAALWQLPLGLLAAAKVAGGVNSVHALHFAGMALLLVGGELASKFVAGRAWLRVGLLAALLGGSLAESVRLFRQQDVVWSVYRGQEELLAQSRSRPGGYYYPWNPLITIISDRRVYPFDDALLCLWRAGLEPPPEAIRRAVPAGAILIYQEPSQSHFAARYFTKKPATKP